MIDNNIKLIVIDSFCGAGGVTEGFHRAEINRQKVCKVIIGINHDDVAIASHAANHPDTIHFVEDFTTLDPHKLVDIVAAAKANYPNAKVLFWMSAECTHHSKAKGGMSRDADSRSLPEYAERYVEILKPDIIGVENVVEFIDWGPLSEAGKPIKEQKGIYYTAWRDSLIKHGYHYEYQRLNAADYGAYTSRIRYFGIFAKDKANIAFPVKTHSKKGDMFTEKWKAVRNVLELEVEGESIFSRKRPLVDATLERIMNGIVRFVIGGTNDFLLKYNSMSQSKKYKSPSVDEPSPTISCQDRIGVVKAKFMQVSYSGAPWRKNFSLDRPAHTVTTIDHHNMITAYCGNDNFGNKVKINCNCGNSWITSINTYLKEPCKNCGGFEGTVTFINNKSDFISAYYGNGYNSSINDPCGTVTTKDRFALVTSKFFDEQYGNGKAASIENPAGTLTTNPKHNLVSAKWLMNPQFNNKGASIEKPCFTLIARMDKMPPYLVETKSGTVKIVIYDSDSDTMKKLKQICNDYGIIDIMMRMLLIEELLRIQGFGDTYKLKGTKAEMKKFIGNAVECNQARVLAESIAGTLVNELLETA